MNRPKLGDRAAWALAVAVTVGLLAAAGGAARWLAAARTGRLTFAVAGTGPIADDPQIRRAWARRLPELELTITPTGQADHVRVDVDGVPAEADSIEQALTRPGKLEMTEVVDGTSVASHWFRRARDGELGPDVVGEADEWSNEKTGESRRDYYLRAPSAAALDEAVEKLTVDDPPSDGVVVRYQRVEPQVEREDRSRAPYYRTYLVRDTPFLDERDVAKADPTYDQNTLRPEVIVRFTPDGARKFGDATAALVGHKLAIVLDGEVASAPIVQSAIRGGVSTITMGGADSATQEREAMALIAVLRSKAELPGGLTATLEQARPGAEGLPWLAPLLVGLLAGLAAFVASGRLARIATVDAPAPRSRGLAGLSRVGLGLVLTLGVPWLLLWLPSREEVHHLLLPGVNDVVLGDVLSRAGGGALDTSYGRFNVLVLGVVPVVSAFWLVEGWAFVTGRRHRLGRADDRRGLDRAALVVTLVLALIQGFFVAQLLDSTSLTAPVFTGGRAAVALVALTAAAGVAFLIVIAGLITRHGLCNGYLAFLGVGAARGLYQQLSEVPRPGLPDHRLALAVCLAAVALVAVTVTALRDRTEARTRQPWPCLSAVAGLTEAVGLLFLLLSGFGLIARLDVGSSWLWKLAVRPLWFDVLFAITAVALVVRWLRLPVTRLGVATATALLATLFGVRWLAPSVLAPATFVLPTLYATFLAVEVVLALRARLGLARPIAVFAVHDVDRADRAADALAAAGIPASVEGLRLRAILRGLAAFAPIVLRVDAADAERAARVVAEVEAARDPSTAAFAT